jgi:hypothetical protein
MLSEPRRSRDCDKKWTRLTADSLRSAVKTASRGRTPSQIGDASHVQSPAASRSFSRLAAKNRPNKRRVRSFSRRAHQISALLPSRSKIPASSAEIVAFPVRKSRPV